MNKSLLVALLITLALPAACSKQEETESALSNTLVFQDKVYTFEGTRQPQGKGFVITEYKQLTSRIYFVSPTEEMNMFLFSDQYKKTFEELGLEVYSLGDVHIGYNDHSIIYIVPANSGDSLVVLLAVKTAEYKEKHEEASEFLNALKALSPAGKPIDS